MSTNWLYYHDGTQPYPPSFVPPNYLPSYGPSWQQHHGFAPPAPASSNAADLAQPVNHDYPATSHYPEPPSSQPLPSQSTLHIETGSHSLQPYTNDHPRSPPSLSTDYDNADSFQAPVQEAPYTQVLDTRAEGAVPQLADVSQEFLDTASSSSAAHQCPVPSFPLDPSSSHPAVKVEPNDPEGCFIMENPPAPSAGDPSNTIEGASTLPAEVPLRASQASQEMREMMGVFRVNPFSIQGGSKGGASPVVFGEARPLEEEPRIIEFQLNVPDENLPDDPPPSPTDDVQAAEDAKRELNELRPFSPEFELRHEQTPSTPSCAMDTCDRSEREHEAGSDWEDVDYNSHGSDTATTSTVQSIHTPSNGHVAYAPIEDTNLYEMRKSQSPMRVCPPQYPGSWEIADSQGYCHSTSDIEDEGSSSRIAEVKTQRPLEVVYPVPLRAQRLHTATSHPYLRKSVLQAQVAASSSQISPSPPHIPGSQRQPTHYATSSYTHPHPQIVSPMNHHPQSTTSSDVHCSSLPTTNHSQAHTPPCPPALPHGGTTELRRQQIASPSVGEYHLAQATRNNAHTCAYGYQPETGEDVDVDREGGVENYEVASGNTFFHAQPDPFYSTHPIPPRRWSLPDTNVSQGHLPVGPFLPS